jgi:hypothetical protein
MLSWDISTPCTRTVSYLFQKQEWNAVLAHLHVMLSWDISTPCTRTLYYLVLKRGTRTCSRDVVLGHQHSLNKDALLLSFKTRHSRTSTWCCPGTSALPARTRTVIISKKTKTNGTCAPPRDVVLGHQHSLHKDAFIFSFKTRHSCTSTWCCPGTSALPAQGRFHIYSKNKNKMRYSRTFTWCCPGTSALPAQGRFTI